MKGGQTVMKTKTRGRLPPGEENFNFFLDRFFTSLRGQRLDKLARRRAEDLAFAVNDADGAREDAFGEVQRDELFIADLVSDGGFRQDRNADPDLDRALDCLDVVELHHEIDFDIALFEYAVNRLARRDVSLEGDEIFSGERLDAHAMAARQLMFGVANDDELVVAKRNDGEVRPPEWKRDNAEIDSVVETGLVDLVGATVFDVDFNLRVGLDEPFDVGRQFVQADAVNGGHLDRSGDRRRLGPQPLFQRAETFDNLPTFGVKNPPGLGGRHATRRPAALDQPLFESLFERLDLLADGRLGNEVERGGFRKTPRLDQVTEGFECLNVHVLLTRAARLKRFSLGLSEITIYGDYVGRQARPVSC